MQSKSTTVDEYLAELTPERRQAVSQVREVIRAHLQPGFEEGMQYGMLGYYVPHSLYPAGYHCDRKQPLPFVHVASQKNHLSLYLMCQYADETQGAWFRQKWAESGKKKLDMGKSCIRFKKVEDLALDVIGEAIQRVSVADHIRFYEASIR
jgi:hypothetical protein